VKILAIIPARCGSKGIPFKNIVDVCGKPLIKYTIDIAIQLKKDRLLNEVLVSTDCEEIATISRKLGANVPFIRPDDIAGDKAKSIDYILHTLEYFEKLGISYDSVLVLQPTSPLRTYDDVMNSINIFLQNSNDSLVSVYKEVTINNLIMYRKDKNIAIPFSRDHNKGIRRQDHGSVYIRNGAIYIAQVDYIKKEKKIISDMPLMYEMSKTSSINIDHSEDLEYVRNLLCR
jgi:N-acylneuraminate cytidylyltransferase/CMP-N,N'-diacetyllegionaminic acid synthase